MITGRIVDDFGRSQIWISIHFDHVISVVDAVLALVQNDIRVRGTGILHLGQFTINHPSSTISKTSPVARSGITVAANPVAHGHAARTRNTLAGGVDPER